MRRFSFFSALFLLLLCVGNSLAHPLATNPRGGGEGN